MNPQGSVAILYNLDHINIIGTQLTTQLQEGGLELDNYN